MNNFKFIIILTWLCGFGTLFAQENGQELYQKNCAACHKVGGGRLVGPDLSGINERRTKSWLIQFIKSSQALVKSGDKDAVAVFNEYKIVMPDQPLSNTQIEAVLAYIKQADGGQVAEKSSEVSEAVAISPEDILLGQNLFEGRTRFANGGPACNSCHHVKNDAVIGGGVLAIELTTVFTKMGGQGVRAILGGPPFPVMQAAYSDKPFTEKEIHGLVAFLKNADKEHMYQQPRDYGWGLVISGLAGAIILQLGYYLVGRRRKKWSVNKEIFDRQKKSE